MSERDPTDISKEFSIRCKLRQLNLSIQEHDGLVEKQREIERSITELEENPPRYIFIDHYDIITITLQVGNKHMILYNDMTSKF